MPPNLEMPTTSGCPQPVDARGQRMPPSLGRATASGCLQPEGESGAGRWASPTDSAHKSRKSVDACSLSGTPPTSTPTYPAVAPTPNALAKVSAADADAVAPTPIALANVSALDCAADADAVAPTPIAVAKVSALDCAAEAEAVAPTPIADAEATAPSLNEAAVPAASKLPLTEAGVANPVPDVMFIAPVTVSVLPSQTSLSPKLNLPVLSI